MKNPNTGAFVSAHGAIPGTKFEPFKVRNGAVQVDGNALEFNIEPAASAEQFVGNVLDVFEQMKAMVPGYNVVVEPIAVFDDAYFASLPDEAREIGCQPDWNAYTGEQNVRPESKASIRAAGGHIHLGWTKDVDPFDPNHFDDCRAVVKQLDHFLGTYSLCWDKDSTRRGMYGKAGAFRPKPYGVEYRTLSNAWLKSPELIRWVYDHTRLACEVLYSGKFEAERSFRNTAQHIIDKNNYNWNYSFGEYIPRNVPTFLPPPGGTWAKGHEVKKPRSKKAVAAEMN